jgi:coatomer subunit alpha
VQASNFQLAYEACSKINTVEYWKQLGDEALKQGVYAAYEMACNKLRQYDKLNFLYSLQNNKKNIEKVMKLANKNGNMVLSYNAALFLGAEEEQENMLRDCGLEALAELAHQARTGDLSDRLKALGSGELTSVQPEE